MEGQNNIKETGGYLWDGSNDDTPLDEAPPEVASFLYSWWHSSPLVVPSHFIQGTTCARIPLSSYDGRLSRFKVCVRVRVRLCLCLCVISNLHVIELLSCECKEG